MIRIQRFSRTPEAPVVCVANATVMMIRTILEGDPTFQFDTTLNYDVGSATVTESDEHAGLPFLNPQEAARERIELLKLQLSKLARGDTSGFKKVDEQQRGLEQEWLAQEEQENAEIEHFRSLPPPAVPGPSLDEILSRAAAIASSVPHVLEVQCMVRIPRINNKQASAIIGVRGANIKDIQEASGCKIKIIDSPDAVHTGVTGPGATSLKEVVVTGQVNQVHGGLMGIAELMIEADMGATEASSRVSAWLRAQRLTSQHPAGQHSPRMGSSRRFDQGSDYDRSKRGRR